MIKVATDENFQEVVLGSERPVIVDFWATWCGPCKLSEPIVDALAEKYDGQIDVYKIDVDANPMVTQALNIMSIPTLAMFSPGKQPIGVVGFHPLERLEKQFGLGG
jgi:thioredoxin 1